MIDCRIKYGAETAAKPESRSPLKHKLIVAELPCTMQRDLGVTHARKDRVAAGAQTSSHSEISLIWPLYQTLSGCGSASKRRWTKRRAYGSWRSDVHSISLPPIPTPQMMYAYPRRYKNPYSSGVHPPELEVSQGPHGEAPLPRPYTHTSGSEDEIAD